jgi:transposase
MRIRSSTHRLEPSTNKCKKAAIDSFLSQYGEAVQYFIDFLWENPYSYNNKLFCVKDDLLECPNMLITKGHIVGRLSQRALKCAATQACGIVKSAVEKRRRRIYVLEKLKDDNKDTSKLQKIIDTQVISKPRVGSVPCELNSICCDVKIEGVKHFDAFVRIKYTGFGDLKLPIKFHRAANKLKERGTLLKSVLVSKSMISLRWELPEVHERLSGATLGADQGKTTCLSLSDGQVTKKDSHGHDLDSILKRLKLKKKGSKGFKRSQDHRSNYINWSINQINLSKVNHIKLEEVKDLRRGKKTSREMSHWTYPLIKRKLELRCEDSGVRLSFQSSPFRSQRCSQCGMVCGKNRTGKLFSCVQCGYADDSDLNAAKNHEAILPDLYHLQRTKYNVSGFFWREDGAFLPCGKELTVPCAIKNDDTS